MNSFLGEGSVGFSSQLFEEQGLFSFWGHRTRSVASGRREKEIVLNKKSEAS